MSWRYVIKDCILANFQGEEKLAVRHISAITLAVQDMSRAVAFYRVALGLDPLYGGADAGLPLGFLQGELAKLPC